MWGSVVEPVAGVLNNIIGVVDQYVEDKDLKAKLIVEMRKIEMDGMTTLLKTTTTPWVDGVVKLMYASVSLVRPLTSVGLFLYGLMYPESLSKLYEIDQTLGTVAGAAVFGSAPAWGISRHMQKKTEAKEKGAVEKVKAAKNSNVIDMDMG
jgi:hypothetical protein